MISMNLSKSRKRFEKKHRLKENRLYEFFTMFVTFFIVCIGLILFRAESIGMAWEYICGIFTLKSFVFEGLPLKSLVYVVVMLLIEWVHREKSHGMEIGDKFFLIRWGYYIFVLLMIFVYGAFNESFIYFQF